MNPSIWKSLTGSAEAEAIEIFTAQKKIQQMRTDIETMLQYSYGQQGLEEYKDTLRRVKKQREETVYRKEKFKEALILWVFGILLTVSGVAVLALIIYFIGTQQGKW